MNQLRLLFLSAGFLFGSFFGIYLYFYFMRIMKFYGINTRKMPFRLLAIAIAALLVWNCQNPWTTRAMVILHLIAFAIAIDLAAFLLKLFFGKRGSGNSEKARKAGTVLKKLYGCGLLPVILTGLLLAYGYGNMQHIQKTEYQLETEKITGEYTLVLITDTHYGTIQNTGLLKAKAEEISRNAPDLVVLGGDIVEEGTSKAQMEEAFRILGGIKAKYGVYYVYGNHDKQPYTQERSFTDAELAEAATGNGITILEDSYVEINDDLILAGRGDAAWGNLSGRASVAEILRDADRNKYIIVADHQPIAAEENNGQGVDLLVSGHTHAGQMWPVGHISGLLGVLNYGEYQAGSCKVIVSSGFTGWGYPFRTQEHCEYVVIRIIGTGGLSSN